MKTLKALPLLLLILLLGGCTQNNGDIGDLFGFWRLKAIEGGEYYQGNSTWAFQGKIVRVSLDRPHQMQDEAFGSFVDMGEALRFDFTHWQSAPDYAYAYTLPKELGLPGNVPFVMDVKKRSGKSMWLEYEGRLYKFEKVY